MLGDLGAAEDIVQDAFSRLMAADLGEIRANGVRHPGRASGLLNGQDGPGRDSADGSLRMCAAPNSGYHAEEHHGMFILD
jgi:hypothetical protein